MFVLNKKRLLLILVVALVGVFVPTVTRNNETIQTVALPVSNKVIVLDAGHRRTRWSELKVAME